MYLSKLLETKVTSILRGVEQSQILSTVSALYEGGIRSVEVTFNTPGAARMIEMVKEQFGDRMLVGAGTVLDGRYRPNRDFGGGGFFVVPQPEPGYDGNL